jgi:ABC-type lipoprotein export system ATPase subunit
MRALTLQEVEQSRGTGHRQVAVLRGASLTVESGERVLLEGPSGSGKTTLLAAAGGLLTPDRGEVVVAGRSLRHLSRLERCRFRASHVGFVFQRANLLSGLTAIQNVVLAARLAGESGGNLARRAQDLLDKLRVGHLSGRYPRELSGGEEQRVAVARALMHRPSIVLADEPTGNLDREAGAAVVASLSDLAASSGCAVLVATHDRRLAEFATRRFLLRDGRVEEVERPA